VLRTLLAVAVLAFAGSAQAATGDGAKLAKALKPNIASFYKSKGSSDVFTKVTCVLPSTASTGHCKAYFTNKSQRLTGWFAVTATIDRSTGGVRWRATRVTCRDSKTGASLKC
jgi:hypothetical protein